MAVPMSSFYPYGPSYNDSLALQNDDNSTTLYLSQSFFYFGVNYDRIYVSGFVLRQ